ncbi:hypothetical protein JTL37_35275, partial [Pseudomonas aeruginosa]|nr:hypothetical protein [Pseudomonas aeruginosa]
QCRRCLTTRPDLPLPVLRMPTRFCICAFGTRAVTGKVLGYGVHWRCWQDMQLGWRRGPQQVFGALVEPLPRWCG